MRNKKEKEKRKRDRNKKEKVPYSRCVCFNSHYRGEVWLYCYYSEKDHSSVYQCMHCGRFLYTT